MVQWLYQEATVFQAHQVNEPLGEALSFLSYNKDLDDSDVDSEEEQSLWLPATRVMRR